MNYIDLDNWNRKFLFNQYLDTDFPYINLGADIDVTNLYNFAKSNNLSFYFSMIYSAIKVADSIENFRYRFKDGMPFILDKNRPVFTHIQPGQDLFVMVEGATTADNILDFCNETKQKALIDVPNHGYGYTAGKLDYINCSCIPWIKYNHFVRTITKDGVDCNPKISWGKFENINGKLMMPLSVQTHHGLMDGYHVGQYFMKINDCIQNCIW